MISFPNAKINLGLKVLNKRPDGYHNIETCFYPVPWYDVLEILPSKELNFNISGNKVDGNISDNLVIKTWELLKDELEIKESLNIHLHKVIPAGAGLGGGSSDAAFFIKMVNELLGLNLADQDLKKIVSGLGADCAFFIENKPVIGREKGDKFSKLELDLKGKKIVIVHPSLHISTGQAYNKVDPGPSGTTLEEILKLDIREWKENLVNDFEKSIFPAFPEIENIKRELYSKGAVYSSLSGSGSAVYGIFEEDVIVNSFPPHYQVFQGEL